MFINTRQVSTFLITTNFAEYATVISALFIGFPLPLLPTQILWLNLVTDGVSDVALATEPPHEDVLKQKPRKKEENILSKEIIPFLILMSGIMAAATVIMFDMYLDEGIEKARTVAFSVMALTQLFNVMNMRSLKLSLFDIGFFSNKYIVASITTSIVLLTMVIHVPFFNDIFKFVPLSLFEMLIIALISSPILLFGELYKFIKNCKTK